ncbi:MULTISPECIES: flagellar hook-associated protein FlgK [Sporosarcina]|uniref:Flagellar hook-associated protein 1 n=1 Tax=Sporosarcina newyorkensis TaxID=759851 RepID=A0A1T4Y1F7_9BACL|nr:MULTISPECIES: flagellar hook-associated protein FlgK [Sporosarcina]MBY0223503.1 flagellar hook-associated protein FlgK [Sporosarcina aquimarina]SKA95629.1 flagellar hook-associated protein 1 FlgK [Sporosarcina newyorkensis]
MRSTFMGLETSKRGLYTQQSALYTTGHNISNANTLGYSRQRVNMQATSGFPGVGMNAGTMPGFLGTGVEAGSIQRIRDGFVDKQFRDESNKLGYWESQTKAIAQMEDVLAEPSKYGLQQSLSDFWQSLQTLAANPENGGARAVVVERGVAVADSFNYIHKSLEEIQTNLGKEIGVSTKDINSILTQIGELNRQIAEVEPNGYLPNDLYDARDGLLDQLSTYLPIEVSYEKTGGRAPAIAEGTVTVKIKTDGDPITVVQKKDVAKISVDDADTEGNPTGAITGFTFTGNGLATGGDLDVNEMQDAGSLKSLVNSFGYVDGDVKGLYPDMLAKLDKMADAFMKEFNAVHSGGEPLPTPDGQPAKPKVNNFFEGTGAAGIKVVEAIQKDPSRVNASGAAGEVGNAENAKKLGDVLFKPLGDLGGSSVQTYYSGVIGELGVEGQQAVKMTQNSMTLLGAVSNRRDSVSSVSLDEEMTDMIRFQQAYNASARMVTVMDETLDKIINGMGVVGR